VSEYPVEILPSANKKHIECDTSNYYFLRNIDLVKDIPIWNELGQLNANYFCNPSHNIRDFSVSLAGHFKVDHTKIRLTHKGKTDFGECDPNFQGSPPVKTIDYNLNDSALYWSIMVSLMNNVVAKIKRGDDDVSAVSYIKHTPMKWNFWHFSIRWLVDGIDLVENPNGLNPSQLDAIFKKIGGKIRAQLATHIQPDHPIFLILPDNCFKLS
jgi:hypothetical protein